MTNKDIVRSFLDHYGLEAVKDEYLTEGEMGPLTPWFVIDLAQYYYDHCLKGGKWVMSLKRRYEAMREGYNAACSVLNSALDLDQQIYITEKFDGMKESLSHDLLLAELAYQNVFMQDVTPEQENVLGGLLMYGNLARIAEESFDSLFRRRAFIRLGLKLPSLSGGFRIMRVNAREFGYEYMKINRIPNNVVSERCAEQLVSTGEVLMLHLAKWINNERGSESRDR